jgi:hypothetical protein
MSKSYNWFLNHYRHDDCPVQPGIEWEDAWECMCNDRCPACNAEIEPYESVDLGIFDDKETS